MNERRFNRRVKVDLVGQLNLNEHSTPITVTVKDLALRGALIEPGLERERIGSTVVVVLFDDEPQVEAVTIRGDVVDASEYTCQIHFTGLDQEDLLVLEKMILRHNKEPKSLNHEIQNGYIPLIEDWSITGGS